mgnify:CR=1 FL=1
MPMRPITEQEAYLRLAALCARSEHCSYEMTEKMRRWELSEEACERVLRRLVQERYVDDSRYARAFVRDKVRYSKWGRRKVEQALWQKRVGEEIRRQALDEVGDEDYLSALRPLLRQRRKALKTASEYEASRRLAQYALSRGYTYDIIRQCLDVESDELVEPCT